IVVSLLEITLPFLVTGLDRRLEQLGGSAGGNLFRPVGRTRVRRSHGESHEGLGNITICRDILRLCVREIPYVSNRHHRHIYESAWPIPRRQATDDINVIGVWIVKSPCSDLSLGKTEKGPAIGRLPGADIAFRNQTSNELKVYWRKVISRPRVF